MWGHGYLVILYYYAYLYIITYSLYIMIYDYTQKQTGKTVSGVHGNFIIMEGVEGYTQFKPFTGIIIII